MYHPPLPITLAESRTRAPWRRRLASVLLTAITACCGLMSGASTAEAATRTFKPAGVNGFWSNPANWEEGIAPADGDDLVFPVGPVAHIVHDTVNDIVNLRVHSFTVIGQYKLGGQPLFLGAGGFRPGIPGGTGIVWMNLLLTLEADQTWDATGFRVGVDGELRLAGHTLTVEGRTYDGVQVNGVLSGVGRLVMNSVGFLVLNNSNSFSGQTIVNSGVLQVLHENALGISDGTAGNGTFINDGGSLILGNADAGYEFIRVSGRGWANEGALRGYDARTFTGPIELVGDVLVRCLNAGSMTFAGPISGNGRLVLGDGQSYDLAGTNSFTGGVQFGTGILTGPALRVSGVGGLPGTPVIDLNGGIFTIDTAPVIVDSLHGMGSLIVSPYPRGGVLSLRGQGEAVFDGPISGGGTITLEGPVSQTFTTSNNLFTGTLGVGAGTLTLTNPVPATRTVVDGNGNGRLALKASGGVGGELVVGHGMLQVGAGAASTVTSGRFEMRPFATFELSGSLPASLAKLSVTGTVELDDATLSLVLPEGFSPTVGQAFTIVENDDADAVVDTFGGLPEGSTISARGVTFTISYVGGTGNDVVLTATDFVREYYLSEGATGSFFTTDILIANPNLLPTVVTITFLKSDGTSVVVNDSLPSQSQWTLKVNGVAGMEATAFSTIVTSDTKLPLVVERTMSWDATGYGSHTERAIDGPAKTWYFAEGSQGFFSTYVLLANPQSTANSATVQYLIEGSSPIVRTYPLEPSSRFTIDIGADAALVNQSFGMTVTFDQPGIAERAMYFGSTPLWKAGHESAGVTAPSTTWFLAEGATGPFFETFVLLANPNPVPVTATLTFLPATGQPVVKTKPIPPIGRVTVNIEAEDASLASAAVATSVSAPAPIIVERSQYWPDPAAQWHEAHNSFGVVATGTKWGLAEGRVGGPNHAQTYILLANPGTTAAQVEIRLLRENAASITGTFTVQPGTRHNVAVGSDFVPALEDENFGAVITSTQPIVVERALYWDANGVTWAAGSNATATRLPF